MTTFTQSDVAERWLGWANVLVKRVYNGLVPRPTVDGGADYRMVILLVIDEAHLEKDPDRPELGFTGGYRQQLQRVYVRSAAYPFADGIYTRMPAMKWVIPDGGGSSIPGDPNNGCSYGAYDMLWVRTAYLPPEDNGVQPILQNPGDTQYQCYITIEDGYFVMRSPFEGPIYRSSTQVSVASGIIPYPSDYTWIVHPNRGPSCLVGGGPGYTSTLAPAPTIRPITDHFWVPLGSLYWKCKTCNQTIASASYPSVAVCQNIEENVGYTYYKTDKTTWAQRLAILCPNQHIRVGILQLANPGPEYWPEQTYGTGASGYYVDGARDSFYSDIRDLLPDTSWGKTTAYGGTLNLTEEDGSLPRDTNGTFFHKVIPFPGVKSDGSLLGPRLTSQQVIDFYNELTNNNAFNPDLIELLWDGTPSVRIDYSTYIGTDVLVHNDITHLYEGQLPADIEIQFPNSMANAIAEVECYLRRLSPPGGLTPNRYRHPLVGGSLIDERWLRAMANSVYEKFNSDQNDGCCRDGSNLYHVLGRDFSSSADMQYWAALQGSCPGVESP